MEEIYDCTLERESTILLNGLNRTKMDSNYTLFFDESGNSRCFWIKDGKYNVDPYTHFVLGGIVASNKIDFDYAKNKIECNSTVKEIKSKNVYRGSFEESLKSKKLENYINLLIEQKWFVHFSVVELFYYGIVDIIDSIVDVDADVLNLKNELNKALRYNKEKTIDMMVRYNYPNVNNEDKKSFLETCIALLDDYRTNIDDTNGLIYKLRMYFLLAQNRDELVFLQNEETGCLIKDFSTFYLRPIYMFRESDIIFDEELNVQDKVRTCPLAINGKVLTNYKFENSKDNVMIQLSDVFVGLMARYLRFLNENMADVDCIVDNFDCQQRSAFIKLNYIIYNSLTENDAFVDMFLSSDMRRVFSVMVEKYRLNR